MSINGTGNVQDELNRCMPAAKHAQLGDVLNDLITQFNALLAHLDTANVAGISNTNVATFGIKTLSQRGT